MELVALRLALERVSARAQQELSFNALFHQWKSLVMSVEKGYSESLYEYINDLAARILLEEIADSVPAGLGNRINEELAPWDLRFKAATRPVAVPLENSSSSRPEEGQSWHRVPIRLCGELKEDLESIPGFAGL